MNRFDLKQKCNICIPIVGITKEDIIETCKAVNENKADLIEIRIDYYEEVYEIEKVVSLLREIRTITNLSILFTFRTINEGGFKEITDNYYIELLSAVSNEKLVDIIDVEFSFNDCKSLIKLIKANTTVLISYHNFEITPNKKELKKIISKMVNRKADIVKIAVMPKNEKDVITLISLANYLNKEFPETNYALMSMGDLGKISRIAAVTLGSCLTFASFRNESAPGQIDLDDLDNIVKVLKPVTTVYFVRHAEPIHDHKETESRPLTNEGRADCYNVVKYFKDIKLDIAYSSTYVRSYTTIIDTCNDHLIPIIKDERLRERVSGTGKQTTELIIKRWEDKEWHEEGGESLKMVQDRNIEILNEILNDHREKTIIIGTHGTALSTILNYYDPSFDSKDFFEMVDLMPYIVKLEFYGTKLVSKEVVFELYKEYPGIRFANNKTETKS